MSEYSLVARRDLCLEVVANADAEAARASECADQAHVGYMKAYYAIKVYRIDYGSLALVDSRCNDATRDSLWQKRFCHSNVDVNRSSTDAAASPVPTVPLTTPSLQLSVILVECSLLSSPNGAACAR
jgi:hypothetical protein